jgi:hypothetical protein
MAKYLLSLAKITMENLEETPAVPEQVNLLVTEEMRSYIYEMAKWASFLSIVGFIFTGLTVILAFTIGAASNASPQMSAALGPLGAMGGVALTIFFLIIAFATFYPSLLLFKYANKAKFGVLYGEQESLAEAFSKLKSLFKFWGIMVIIYISLNLIMFISTLVTGAAAG